MMAVCDSRYRLIYVDIGAAGSNSDGGVFSTSELKRLMDENELNLPQQQRLPCTNIQTPFFMVGDAAFPLRVNLMKPFARQGIDHDKKIFNYR